MNHHKTCGMIAIIVLLLQFLPLGESYKIPANPPTNIVGPQPLIQGGESAPPNAVRTESTYISSISSSPTYLGSDLQAKKIIMPNDKDNTLINKTYRMSVEIKGSIWNCSDVLVIEQVDPHIEITNLSGPPCSYDPFSKENISLKSKCYEIDKKNNTIYIRVANLVGKKRIKYSYDFRSNKTGTFEFNSLIRIGKASSFPDLEFPKEITFRTPNFDVDVDIEKLQVFEDFIFSDYLPITYNIVYRSASSLNPIDANLTFDNSSLSEYEIFIKNNTTWEPYNGKARSYNFNPLKGNAIDARIYYKTAGSHRIPEILIDGNPYIFDIGISVHRRIPYHIQEYYPLISIALLIATLIATVVYAHREFELKKKKK